MRESLAAGALEPEIDNFVRRCAEIYDDSTDLGIEAQRRAYDRYCAHYTPSHPDGVLARDELVETHDGAIPVRRYRSATSTSRTGILYLHGGGFVVGGLDSHDFICARLTDDTGACVISVDYRLAPEHRFPAAFDDCCAVLREIRADTSRWGIDPERMIVAGDSAGGNLAAAVAQANRDRGEVPLMGQILVYPVLSAHTAFESYAEQAEAPMLRTRDVEYYARTYLGPGVGHTAYSAPLLAPDLTGLAPALLLAAEFDPLRDDAIAYHQGLRQAGVASELLLGRGLVHGCLRALDSSPGTSVWYRAVLDFVADLQR